VVIVQVQRLRNIRSWCATWKKHFYLVTNNLATAEHRHLENIFTFLKFFTRILKRANQHLRRTYFCSTLFEFLLNLTMNYLYCYFHPILTSLHTNQQSSVIVASGELYIYLLFFQRSNQGERGGGEAPKKIFIPPRKMCWIYFKKFGPLSENSSPLLMSQAGYGPGSNWRFAVKIL